MGGYGPWRWARAAGDAASGAPEQSLVRSPGQATCRKGAEAGSPSQGSGEEATPACRSADAWPWLKRRRGPRPGPRAEWLAIFRHWSCREQVLWKHLEQEMSIDLLRL